jgi:hypothetical protein
MKSLLRFATVVALLLTPGLPAAQSQKPITIRVSETASIRRTSYPSNARVHFERGVLQDAAHVRLMSGANEVAAQIAAESLYPDGSVQWLAVDFNTSLGPRETAEFRLEFGDDIKRNVEPRGLALMEDAAGIQIGNVRLSRTGVPLLSSVKYRREDIRPGANGFAVIDTTGQVHDAATARQAKVEVVKRGPFYAVVRYTGDLPLSDNYAVGYATSVEMPNSKSWVKTTTTIADPEKRVSELVFRTPLALGAQPWTWDFGTGSWSYGLLRNPNESATLVQHVGPARATKWEIRSGVEGQEQLIETSGGRRPNLAEGWGHVQDQSEAVAFAVPDFGSEAGTYSCTIDGSGQLSIRWAPARPLVHLQLTVYEHFVSTPVPVGAVTSPVSMLNPLVISVVSGSAPDRPAR